TGLPGAYGISLFRGELYATFATDVQNGLARVGGSPQFSAADIYLGGFPNGQSSLPPYAVRAKPCPKKWNAAVLEETLLYSQGALGTIYDVTSPVGALIDIPRVVTDLIDPVGMIFNPVDRLLYVAEGGTGSVKAFPINAITNARFVLPVATGFQDPSCVRF